MVRATILNGAGKKGNERRTIRKRKKNPPSDVSQYGDRIDVEASIESDSPYEVVFIAQTKATTCYGCKGGVRDKGSDQPGLRLPHMIFSCGIRSVCISAKRGKQDLHYKNSRGGVLPSVALMCPTSNTRQHRNRRGH